MYSNKISTTQSNQVYNKVLTPENFAGRNFQYVTFTKSSDSFNKLNNNDPDDGHISVWEKVKNFGKGLVSPITSMFSSVKNFVIGSAFIAAGFALCIATSGAILPFMIALGIGFGVYQLGSGTYKALTAITDNDAKKAWQNIGAGVGIIGLSATGAKGSLRSAGTNVTGLSAEQINNMNLLQATTKCLQTTPASVSKSISMIRSGEATSNLTSYISQLGIKLKSRFVKQSTENAPQSKNITKANPKENTIGRIAQSDVDDFIRAYEQLVESAKSGNIDPALQASVMSKGEALMNSEAARMVDTMLNSNPQLLHKWNANYNIDITKLSKVDPRLTKLDPEFEAMVYSKARDMFNIKMANLSSIKHVQVGMGEGTIQELTLNQAQRFASPGFSGCTGTYIELKALNGKTYGVMTHYSPADTTGIGVAEIQKLLASKGIEASSISNSKALIMHGPYLEASDINSYVSGLNRLFGNKITYKMQPYTAKNIDSFIFLNDPERSIQVVAENGITKFLTWFSNGRL